MCARRHTLAMPAVVGARRVANCMFHGMVFHECVVPKSARKLPEGLPGGAVCGKRGGGA